MGVILLKGPGTFVCTTSTLINCNQLLLQKSMAMATTTCIVASIIILSTFALNVNHIEAKPTALFVFGDSYADTGNHDPSNPNLNGPWKRPYGITWPGKPTGRYSNGRVLTDYFASYLGIKTPLPYRVIKGSHAARLHATRGINFAFGGSGVFPTFGPLYPTVAAQIDQFRATISSGLVPKNLIIQSSIALLVVAGNDYTAYSLLHPGDEGLSEFTAKVAAQIATSVEALYELGFKRLAVTNLEPFGCFPGVTYRLNYSSCNGTQNERTAFHNKLLASHMSELQKTLPSADLITLDLERAFLLALQGGSNNTKPQWRPCCEGIEGADCGTVDSNGRPLYILCSSPKKSFFWDSVHPTSTGWEVVSKILLTF